MAKKTSLCDMKAVNVGIFCQLMSSNGEITVYDLKSI